jgi:hypothetical protein
MTVYASRPKASRREGPVAFMHIPKAAGSAITGGLRQALQPRREVFGWDLSNFGTFRDVDSFAPHVRRHIYPHVTDMPYDADFVTGHIAYSSISRRYPGIHFITVLREPLCRLMSFWMFQRSHGEAGVAPWGDYGPQQRLAQRPLVEFLRNATVASETDNIVCRKLLWPNSLVPDDNFVHYKDDQAILLLALDKLSRFDFVEVLENTALVDNFSTWLDLPFKLCVANETLVIPPSHRTPFEQQLTEEACALMQYRCRLDRMLWEAVVKSKMPSVDVNHLRHIHFTQNVARYSRLMAA